MKPKNTIKKILIANRGEIALRIARTCRAMGIIPVSIYATGEENLPHVTEIEEHYCLGVGSLADTYLNQEKIIAIAGQAKADAIHPGYGFLSENASFCRRVHEAGIIFIGPTAEVIELMGDKIASRQCVMEIGVPLIPGYNGASQDAGLLAAEAGKICYPLLIKASAGGGGKGMRLVEQAGEFAESLRAAKGEAQNAFGDDTVYLEKYITQPRHIEVQVFSDSHGNHVHLFERECSIQRRHQKILEETPSTALDNNLRKEITETAVSITKHIGYLGAGTIEFILDMTGKFYFLEMNTRLQVEHPITEMVTGTDLVEWQINVAEGNPLPLLQKDITSKGHAVEVRIYAEDPDNHFLPTTGKIAAVGLVPDNHIRLECGYAVGNEIGTSYDPMLAKLIAWGENRSEAAARLENALEHIVFAGFKTNREYLIHILASDPFLAGETHTDFVVKHAALLAAPPLSDNQMARYIAGYLLNRQQGTANSNYVHYSPWTELKGFRNV